MSSLVMSKFNKESEMLQPLLHFLLRAGRINEDTALSTEFPWLGRRVDLAVLTKTQRTAAYELKLSNNFKAVEQASRNALAFDRSYAVTATSPSAEVLRFARLMGVGVLCLRSNSLKVLLTPSDIGPVEPQLRTRLISRLQAKTISLGEGAYV